MTDRYSSLTVVLEKDIREDDAESLINAIRHIKGVIRVEGNVSDISELVARSRIRSEVGAKLADLIEDIIRG